MDPSLVDLVIGLGMRINHGLLVRKANKFLDEATFDSVSNNLGKILSLEVKGIKEREFLQTTFDKYCVQDDASQQKHWNEASFKEYVRSIHSAAAVSEAAVLLLWKSFHFYAYHPCPCDTQHAKVDFEAFRRAVLLLVFQCEDILGTQDDGYEDFWPGKAASLHRASFQRVFRSIATREAPTTQAKTETQTCTQLTDRTDSVVGDVMDVLMTLVPQSIHALPSPDQLEPVARRLLAGASTAAQRAVGRDEIYTLMSLLLRMRLRKEKWCWLYNLGDLVEVSPANQELTEVLVNTLTENGGDHRQIMTCQQLLGAIDVISNLPLRFHQLWAVLFLPSADTDNETKPFQAFEAVPTYIGGAISLFVPRFKSDNPRDYYRQRTVNHDARLSLETAQATPDSPNTTITRLVQALSHYSSAHVALFTCHDAVATTQKAVVVGAYFPAEAGEEEKNGESGGNTCAHLLFQLQPRFRLLCWTKPKAPLTDLINTEGKKVSLGEIAQSEYNAPYWIGAATGQGARLRINPKEKTATLSGGGGDDGRGYRDVREGGNNGLGKDWEVTVQNVRMDIFRVMGTGKPRSL